MILKKRRFLLLGLYGLESFFKSDKPSGRPISGFDEYIKFSKIMGDDFWFSYILHSKHDNKIVNTKLNMHFAREKSNFKNFKKFLKSTSNTTNREDSDVLALQIVSTKKILLDILSHIGIIKTTLKSC